MTLSRDHSEADLLPGSRHAHTWRPLRFLNYYRTILAGLFLLLFLTGLGPSTLGRHDPVLFQIAGILYLGLAVISSYTIQRRAPSFHLQVNVQIAADIVALSLIMHASGGLTSGLGILLAVAVAGASMIMAGRLALLYAASATLAVLVEQIYADLTGAFGTTAYTHAGLLGLAFFATALLSFILARRIRESEALAAQRGIDLANMEQLNDYIIRNMQSGVVVVDRDRRVRMINESGWYLLGMPAVREHQRLDELSPDLGAQLRTWLSDPQTEPAAFQAIADAPLILPRFARLGTETTGAMLIFLEDYTSLTQQVQQIKLASLGRLTASIAHEIRNPLGAISHAAQLLGESPDLGKANRRMTEIIRDHSRKMNTIVENVLQLSRREASHPKTFELKPWLEGFADEFRTVSNLTPEQLTVDIAPPGTQVHIDPNHLQQVLWNLCQNAVQHGGAPEVALRGGASAGARGPHLDVIDNGAGIELEIAEQMFDPFFTTAAAGTGLGLYISRELCECNKARLNYLPVPTGGACFRISFHDPNRLKL